MVATTAVPLTNFGARMFLIHVLVRPLVARIIGSHPVVGAAQHYVTV